MPGIPDDVLPFPVFIRIIRLIITLLGYKLHILLERLRSTIGDLGVRFDPTLTFNHSCLIILYHVWNCKKKWLDFINRRFTDFENKDKLILLYRTLQVRSIFDRESTMFLTVIIIYVINIILYSIGSKITFQQVQNECFRRLVFKKKTYINK